MPCFLFTYHAHGTWLPNRQQGYVKRGQGILPPDGRMYGLYVRSMKEPAIIFHGEHQLDLIREVLNASSHQSFEPYGIATDSTHIHILLGWRDIKAAKSRSSSIKWSLSHSLKEKYEKRDWLSEGGSCKQVKNQQHFDYLRYKYLPKHNGWKWQPEKGLYR
jgi:hypothetical protein